MKKIILLLLLLIIPHQLNDDDIKLVKKLTNQEKIQIYVKKYSEIYDIDSKLILAIINVESEFNHKAISHCGAKGLMQLMPQTAKHLGVIDPFDIEQNIMGGTKYFSFLMKQYNDINLALAAYNAGITNVNKYNGIPPFNETQNFVKKVIKIYEG